ncbi:hypothetical protein KUV80_14255 [Fictibacillus nanhaiensis]|uniref:hypothetical protein n=1 Tax=Fictibacillus nanhaiensis TaxID=742169 RepID=UPI001C96CDC9|nr:hypothetical protein [Fictibacillus nanhaiensis]MBY6037831.1 hypothetical protein [Fictibacillus nanhaiensis]
MDTSYVWYVSYGSNLMEHRFLCYILGDQPEGSSQRERGCRNPAMPLKNGKTTLSYPLYFAGERTKWGNGGVAFIGHEKNERYKTYGRKYLITVEQFLDVTAQENSCDEIEADLEEVIQKGYIHFGKGWYSRMVYLGEEEGYPMVTFTCNLDLNEQQLNSPPIAYLTTIAKGLSQVGLTKEEAVTYFANTPGILGKMSEQEIEGIIGSLF